MEMQLKNDLPEACGASGSVDASVGNLDVGVIRTIKARR